MNSFFFTTLAANKPNGVSLALAVSVHACVLVIGPAEGWGQSEVCSSTDTGLSDSVRNLFTCGGATNNWRVYIEPKTKKTKNDFPSRQPYNINRAARGSTGPSY